MIPPLELMQLQAGVLFKQGPADELLALNEPEFQPAPRLFLGRTVDGNVWRFRHDLKSALIETLESLIKAEPPLTDPHLAPRSSEQLRAILEVDAPVNRIWSGPAWTFPELPSPSISVVQVGLSNAEILRPAFPDLAIAIAAHQPCLAVLRDGSAVSICCSSRSSSLASEAGVETLATYRGNGYATAVVTAWTNAVRVSGRIPLYSTSWKNQASPGSGASTWPSALRRRLAHYLSII